MKIMPLIKEVKRRLTATRLHKIDGRQNYVLLGSEYGMWPLLVDHTMAGERILSFGVGRDISFDLEAIARFNCVVDAFDPTPISQEWVDQQNLPPNFTFHPVGVSARDGYADFYAPAVQGHTSFSVAKNPNSMTDRSVQARVLRISSILKYLNIGQPDIIKMDIEGFEYDVLKDMMKSGIRPKQLLVEFHHGLFGLNLDQTRLAVSQLRAEGYFLFYISAQGREYGFMRL